MLPWIVAADEMSGHNRTIMHLFVRHDDDCPYLTDDRKDCACNPEFELLTHAEFARKAYEQRPQ